MDQGGSQRKEPEDRAQKQLPGGCGVESVQLDVPGVCTDVHLLCAVPTCGWPWEIEGKQCLPMETSDLLICGSLRAKSEGSWGRGSGGSWELLWGKAEAKMTRTRSETVLKDRWVR